MTTLPPSLSTDDFNIEVDVDLEPTPALEVAGLRAVLRRLQRRIAGFEAANAELSNAPDASALHEVWRRVSTWGFEDAHPEDGVAGILLEAEAAQEAGARAQAALAHAAARLSHLRRIPCRDCVVIPCPACTRAAAGGDAAVVRRAPLDDAED
ncbi:MAG TPA: hypothetical protein VGQ83_06840 [Polyangia bacterium]|jgi:hypothetical protein